MSFHVLSLLHWHFLHKCWGLKQALADFRGAPRWTIAKTGALRQPRLRCFVYWTRLARLPSGDKVSNHVSFYLLFILRNLLYLIGDKIER